MIDIAPIIKKHHLSIHKIDIFHDYYILYGLDNNYLLKNTGNTDNTILFKSVSYPYYISMINDINDSYELYYYNKEIINDKEIKIKELFQAIILLQENTISSDTILLDDFYHEKKQEINSCFNYYYDLQNTLEDKEYLSPDQYTLLKNISKFYKLLHEANNYLEKWYKLNKNEIRKCLQIKKVSLSNFNCSFQPFFIDSSFSCYDIFFYDFINFCKSNFYIIDLREYFDLYKIKLKISECELYLLLSFLAIPKKIFFDLDCYSNTVLLKREIDYVELVLDFILEENKENQETDEEKFKE